jgi:AraC-like DNA-binding protein
MPTPEELRETHSVGSRTREWMVTKELSPTLADHGIFLCGWSEARQGFRFVRPRFPMSQVLVCTSGQGEVWIDGAWVECGPGMAYLTPSHVLHAYQARAGQPNTGPPWVVYWVTYHTPMVEGKRPLLVQSDPEAFSDAIRHLYSEVHSVADQGTVARWTHLVHTSAERIARPAYGDPRLHRLWEAVLSAPDHPWNVELLAAQIGISGEHLRRLCLREVGCAPMEHVAHLRMQYAVSLFTSGRYTVTAVAERVGYNNPFAFSAAFKRILGIAPSQYVSMKLHPSD